MRKIIIAVAIALMAISSSIPTMAGTRQFQSSGGGGVGSSGGGGYGGNPYNQNRAYGQPQ